MEPAASLMEPALFELIESGAEDDEVGVIIRMAPGIEPPPLVRVVSNFDDIFTARVRRGDIVALRRSPGVISLKATTAVSQPRFLETSREEAFDAEGLAIDSVEGEDTENHEGVPGGGALPSIAEDGTGVVVGICDWGFDFTHPNFRNADGTTRLLCLWDQRGFGDPRAPAPYNYGRLLTREAINAALATADPCGTLGYHPAVADPANSGAHGTHVADILAGNRREPGSEVGLASGSEIVFVHLAAPRLGELGNLGDSVGLLEGLDFCRRQAQALGRPCVLHLSAGKTGGEKRGLSPLERAVDTMLKQPGIVLVQSVGNYADSAMHTQARIGPDQRHVLNWIIPAEDRTPNELEIWYSGEDVFEVTLFAPNGREFSVALDHRMRLEGEDTTWGNFYHRLHEPNSGLNHIAIYLYPNAPSGMWRVALHGRDIVDGRVQAWIERDASRRYQSHFLRTQATPRFTTNTICNCFRAIAVGAYDATRRNRPPTRFSSRGPTADGRQKPEIVAPGYMIRAARSMPRDGWRGDEPRLTVKSGTSMAAPWVSGTVALMMQAAGRPLTVHEIRRALIGSSDPHPGPAGRSSTSLGYGYLNTAAAVAAARQLGKTDKSASAPLVSTESEEAGWAPLWVEDAAEGTGFTLEGEQDGVEPQAIGQETDEQDGTAPSVVVQEECGCSGGRDSGQPLQSDALPSAVESSDEHSFEDESGNEAAYEAAYEAADEDTVEDDEADDEEVAEDEGELIESTSVWEDVRDALEAVGDYLGETEDWA